MKYMVQFDFDAVVYTVEYEASKDMGNEIEDAIASYLESTATDEYSMDEYEVLENVLDSFDEIKTWHRVPCRVIRI
ncbi:MAG: hypothetical protein IKP65_02010 [Alphaproteobacteria bacterium]|nr:hypothetical protein [Alphaproteobacteria bacterium]